MPFGSRKSRTLRRVYTRTPGARTVIHYKLRRPSSATCGGCGTALKGVPRVRPLRLQGLPKTARRPQRAFGGVLCSACTRRALIQKARS